MLSRKQPRISRVQSIIGFFLIPAEGRWSVSAREGKELRCKKRRVLWRVISIRHAVWIISNCSLMSIVDTYGYISFALSQSSFRIGWILDVKSLGPAQLVARTVSLPLTFPLLVSWILSYSWQIRNTRLWISAGDILLWPVSAGLRSSPSARLGTSTRWVEDKLRIRPVAWHLKWDVNVRTVRAHGRPQVRERIALNIGCSDCTRKEWKKFDLSFSFAAGIPRWWLILLVDWSVSRGIKIVEISLEFPRIKNTSCTGDLHHRRRQSIWFVDCRCWYDIEP